MIPFGEVVTISATQLDTPYTSKLLTMCLPFKLNVGELMPVDNFKTDTEISALNGMSDRDLQVGIGRVLAILCLSCLVCL